MTNADNGWTTWSGGDCLFAVGEVEVEFRDGSFATGFPDDFHWSHLHVPKDIVAYRIVDEDMRKREMTKPCVVILGGGPGSIFAYYGALDAGYDREEIEIRAFGLSYPPGAFWLHELPPVIPFKAEPEAMTITMVGMPDDYSRKQWGEVFPTSAAKYAGRTVPAYNPHVVLPKLWETVHWTPNSFKWTESTIAMLADDYEHVIVTFPFSPSGPGRLTIPVYYAQVPTLSKNTCVYNGNVTTGWVRLTAAFGWINLEYPTSWMGRQQEIREEQDELWGVKGTILEVPELHPTAQPVQDVLIGERNNILLTGRWATNNRKALSHDSYYDVLNYLLKVG